MSKTNLSISALSGFGIILISFLTSGIAGNTQERFFCDQNGLYTTVNTERGSLPLIRWIDRSFPPPFTPEQRCKIVSERFQKFDNNGTLKYIKADTVNNLPALCVAAYVGGGCLPDGLLVTFKPGTDANDTLIKLLDQRVWAARETIELDSSGSVAPGEESVISQVDGTTYVNMELFLNWNNK
ncbi:MAG: COP23 domain-containing protein [Pleurocapsa sp.]